MDPVKAGMAAPIDPEKAAEREAGARRTIHCSAAFLLTRDDGSTRQFVKGVNEDVLEIDADHWFVQAHTVEGPATVAAAPQPPLEPTSGVVGDTGANVVEAGGGPQVANGDQTAADLAAGAAAGLAEQERLKQEAAAKAGNV